MRIAVCIKRVPDSTSRIRPAAGGRRIETTDLKYIISPYDEIALEEALRLKEAAGGGEVLVVGLGPPDTQPLLRQALAMGADRALHLAHESPTGLELDGLQSARALARALKSETPDLVLFGKLAIDDQSGQVGGLVAEELGIPCVGEVLKLEWTAGRFRLHHLVEGRIEVVEAAPPVAATAQKGLNEPRYPGIKGIMAAKKKPLASVPAEPGPPAMELLSIEPPPARKPGRIVGQGPEAVEPLIDLLRNEAKVL
jgi:electron transfer flavoprotein beta subunit